MAKKPNTPAPKKRGLTKTERITRLKYRASDLENNARGLIADGSHQGVWMFLQAAELAQKIIDLKPSEDDERLYVVSPMLYITNAIQGIDDLLKKDPAYIRKNFDAMLPLLLAVEKAAPQAYGEWAMWQVVANITVSQEPVKKAEQTNTLLKFLWETLEPRLYATMIDARNAQQGARAKHVESLWEYACLRMYEMSEGTAKSQIKRRLRDEEGKPHKDEAVIKALTDMLEKHFPANTDARRKEREAATLASNDAERIENFRAAQRALTQAGPDQEQALQHAPTRPTHLTAGTAEAKGVLENKQKRVALLKLYTPNSKPN